MSVPRSPSTALIIVSALSVLTLSACQPGVGPAAAAPAPAAAAAIATTVSTATTASTANTATASRVVATGTGGPGSLTLTLTSPRPVNGHIDTTVTCTTGRIYRAQVAGTVDGYTAQLGVTAAGYRGAGTYPIAVTGSVVDPSGQAFAAVGAPRTASIDDAGGTVAFSAADAHGHVLAGTVSWQCS